MSKTYNNDGASHYEEFKCLKTDKYFVNYTNKDMLLVYPNGMIRLGESRIKMHDNFIKTEIDNDNDTLIHIDINGNVTNDTIKRMARNYNNDFENKLATMTGGFNNLVEKYYYGIEGENAGEYHEIPTIDHPVVIKSTTSFVLVLYDDQRSIEHAIQMITNAGGAKKFADSYLTNQFHNMGVGIQYINFSPFDLYFASHDKRRVEVIRHMTREDAIRFINKSRDWTLIDNFTAELEEGNFIIIGIVENGTLNLHKFEREENCSLASQSIQFADASRANEILPIFYRRIDAEIYLEDYDANVSNVYLEAASRVAEKRTETAVSEEIYESKKSMTAVAKVCSAMVTSGLAYAVGKTLIEKIIHSKTKTDNIIRMNTIGNMIKNAGIISKRSAIIASQIGIASKFASAHTIATSAAATGLGLLGPIGIGIGIVIIVGSCVLGCIKKDDAEFEEKHPILSAIGKGLCFIGQKIVEGVKFIGEKIKDVFSAIGNFFSNLFF